MFTACLKRWHDSSCMIRHRLDGHTAVPFYVTNTPSLIGRREHVMEELRRTSATDVTIVHCANGEDVRSARNVSCVHPGTVRTRWTRDGARLRPGTLSLAIKHLLAIYDASLRGLSSAAIVEDDITFEDSMGGIDRYIAACPHDARVFHFASYSRRLHHFGALFPPVPNTSLYVRREHAWIVGGTGYVVFPRYAAEFLRPIRAPLDVQLFLQTAPIYGPQPSYGPSRFLAYPSRRFAGGTHTALLWAEEEGGGAESRLED